MNEDLTASTPPEPTPPIRGGVGPRRALLVSIAGILALVVIAAVFIFVFRGSESDLVGYFEETELELSTINERTAEGDYDSTGPLLIHLSTVF